MGSLQRESTAEMQKECYDLPCGMNFIRQWKWMQFLPISPTFKYDNASEVTKKATNEVNEVNEQEELALSNEHSTEML